MDAEKRGVPGFEPAQTVCAAVAPGNVHPVKRKRGENQEKVEVYLRDQERLWAEAKTKETGLPKALSTRLREAREHAAANGSIKCGVFRSSRRSIITAGTSNRASFKSSLRNSEVTYSTLRRTRIKLAEE